MKFVILFGPPAVGKMTVGTELAKRTEFRLSRKPSKRNVVESERIMLKHEKDYRMNTDGDFFYSENYLKIHNDTLSPEDAAKQIVESFHFEAIHE